MICTSLKKTFEFPLINFKYDSHKIKNILNSTSFEALKKLEINQGFDEAVTNKTTLKKQYLE